MNRPAATHRSLESPLARRTDPLRAGRRDEILAWLRAGRFSGGIRCPRCSCERAHKWGSFSGRQRYRCKGCRRTFSDLTGTPAAYIKKLELWPAFGRGMEEGESLRAAADRLGIHPSTAFRWRHRLLDGLRERDRETLEGWIECWLRGGYAESKKGQRGGLGRPPRTHAAVRPWSIFPDPGATGVLVAHDRRGHVVTGLVRRRVPGAEDLERVLGDRIRGPGADDLECVLGDRIRGPAGVAHTVVRGVRRPAPHGSLEPDLRSETGRDTDPGSRPTRQPGSRPFGHPGPRPIGRSGPHPPGHPGPSPIDEMGPPARRGSPSRGPRRRSPDPGPVVVVARARQALHGFEVFAHRRGGSVRSAWSSEGRHPLVHTETARAYWIRLSTWMVRFRGVATRYLPNYLLWHRWLDRARRDASAEAVLRWPLPTKPTHPRGLR